MTNRILLVVLSAVLIVGLNVACQRNDDRVQAAREDGVDVNTLSPGDLEIATKIEQAHTGELELARLAKERASNKDVKNYAEMLESDHNKALEDLTEILRDKQSAGSTHSKPAGTDMTQLQKMSGAQFDREFLATMVRNHQETLDALNRDLTTVQNPDMKDYIKNLMPKVRNHMEEAQKLQTTLSSTGKH